MKNVKNVIEMSIIDPTVVVFTGLERNVRKSTKTD